MDHQVKGPAFRREDQRGTLVEAINSGSWGSMLIGDVKAGAVVGNHYHKVTKVYFFLMSGAARVELRDAKTGTRTGYDLPAQHGTLLEPGVSHAIRFLEPSKYLMLKSKAYDPKDPDTYALPVEEGR